MLWCVRQSRFRIRCGPGGLLLDGGIHRAALAALYLPSRRAVRVARQPLAAGAAQATPAYTAQSKNSGCLWVLQ